MPTTRTLARRLGGWAALLTLLTAPVRPVAAQTAITPLAPEGRAFGLTLGEWGAAWWQWLNSLPASVNPNVKTSRASTLTGIGQRMPVWFLPRRLGGTGAITFTCPVPAGYSIFLSPLSAYSEFFAGQKSEAELWVQNQFLDLDQTRLLEVSVDGVPIPDVKRYRARTPLFTTTYPPGNLVNETIRGDMPLRFAGVAEGYWLLLPPLPVGEHVIRSRFEISRPDGTAWKADYTYNL